MNADSHTAIQRGSLAMSRPGLCLVSLQLPLSSAGMALRTLAGFAIGHEAISHGTGALEAAQGVPALVLTRVSALTLIDVCGEKHQHLSIP